MDSMFMYNWVGVCFVCDFLYVEYRMIVVIVVDENMKDVILIMY